MVAGRRAARPRHGLRPRPGRGMGGKDLVEAIWSTLGPRTGSAVAWWLGDAAQAVGLGPSVRAAG